MDQITPYVRATADIYYRVPILAGEEGDWALTCDPRRAIAALSRFHRESDRTSLRDHFLGDAPDIVEVYLRPTPGDPEYVWRICDAGHPEAVPALYIGD